MGYVVNHLGENKDQRGHHTPEEKYTIWKRKQKQEIHPWGKIVGNNPSVSQKVSHWIK